MKLYHAGEWYYAVPPDATYELQFERLITQHREDLFPGFICARFDPQIESPLGSVKPDLILVERQYRRWYIVEVELATHSVTRHVKPQVEKIDAGRVNRRHAEWVANREPAIDLDRLTHLMRDVPHRTLLLVNAPTPHWDDALSPLPSIQRAVVEVFRNRLNRTILRVNGDQPETPGDLLSTVTLGTGLLHNTYRVDVPSSLPQEVTEIDISTPAGSSRCRVKTLGGEKYIFLGSSFERMPPEAKLYSFQGRYRIEVSGR